MFKTKRLERSNWGLSEKASAILLKEPEILEDLRRIRELPPLEKEFQPQLLEILFDDVLYIRHERGKMSYYHPCSADFEPTLSEYKLDGETVLFHVGGEVVIERMGELNFHQILKELG